MPILWVLSVEISSIVEGGLVETGPLHWSRLQMRMSVPCWNGLMNSNVRIHEIAVVDLHVVLFQHGFVSLRHLKGIIRSAEGLIEYFDPLPISIFSAD